MQKNILVAVRSWLMLVVLVGSTAADGFADWAQGTSPAPVEDTVEPTPAPAPVVVERHVTPPTIAMIDGVAVEFEGDAVIYR